MVDFSIISETSNPKCGKAKQLYGLVHDTVAEGTYAYQIRANAGTLTKLSMEHLCLLIKSQVDIGRYMVIIIHLHSCE